MRTLCICLSRRYLNSFVLKPAISRSIRWKLLLGFILAILLENCARAIRKHLRDETLELFKQLFQASDQYWASLIRRISCKDSRSVATRHTRDSRQSQNIDVIIELPSRLMNLHRTRFDRYRDPSSSSRLDVTFRRESKALSVWPRFTPWESRFPSGSKLASLARNGTIKRSRRASPLLNENFSTFNADSRNTGPSSRDGNLRAAKTEGREFPPHRARLAHGALSLEHT